MTQLISPETDMASARAARDSLLLGLEAVGNLMFWCDTEQSPESAATNMRKLGQMIETVCVMVADLEVTIENQCNRAVGQ
ncbi:hypothetical protein AE457_002856 [Salmonella enterica subsp. enterica serovar Amsterdam]|uniref:Uncharacterized protein n=1 Tax=Salmonella enterica subsp. enterica serovar Abeokuta TaxID=2926665 RepID=A0A8T9IKQ2_SALET|nr:hypothetical protein [Salmonella enterica]EAA6000262.1 hypothetical protein [Salmonella enterica subsp. enterica serovar Oranienburg]ECC3632998.1 hypothetical protein [Salmonella enterica subsp. enterica]EEH9714139.1 hypothetical protein [Salmonella enterica subsp. enterica serovar Vancouver]EJN2872326.1 hypothetical protein [Salmonella enterica subsp. enterica serovar Techimani]QQL63716.1 hypothetical protein HIX61_03350 [Salmonella enterica subsp. enterica serovar Othmarschen]